MSGISKLVKRIAALPRALLNIQVNFNKLQNVQLTHLELTGRLFGEMNRNRTDIKTIEDAEFKVYSQFGDDGIIQHLVNNLNLPPNLQTFIEFGVESYIEANTRFLLINNNWRGLIMDGSADNMAKVRASPLYYTYSLQAVQAFITAENINGLITTAGFSGEIGLLHIDIDGNDYWVWKAITAVNPVIVIMEYNALFGPESPVTVPYDPAFNRTQKHFSNQYFGSSLQSLCDLAAERGYDFIGSNLHGNNAYFIRKDRNFMPALTAAEGFRECRFRQSRNQAGELIFTDGAARLQEIAGMPVVNTRTGKTEKIA